MPRSGIVLASGSTTRAGLAWGLLGVIGFSLTVPFTRIAVEGLPTLFVGSFRAVVGAVLAAIALIATRQRRPTMTQTARLGIVAGGVVIGFPLAVSYALTTVPASHGAVVLALLPIATAIAGVWRTGEKTTGSFWVFAGLGAGAALGFAILQGVEVGRLHWSDLLLFVAVACAAIGYAEAALLARELGAWQTASWAVVLAAPLMGALTVISVVQDPPSAATPLQWFAMGYLGVVSMFFGLLAWYRGLAIGPIGQVSQVLLAQPVLTIVWAVVLLGERVTWLTVAAGIAVIGCAWLAARSGSTPG